MANSSSRGGARVLWVTVHTAEGIRKASDLAAFFERSTDTSAHAVADDVTLIDNLVPYGLAAWTLRGGNSRSDNLELCGFAAWTRDEWLNNHQGMLDHAARWIRARCLARGIPITKISANGVAVGAAGVIGHVDYTNGTGDGTHWDPGPGFPWDVVIARAGEGISTTQEDDMLTVPSGTDDHVNLFVKGKTQLYVACSWGRHVVIHALYFYGDTGPDGGGTGVGGAIEGLTIDPNRPGPLPIPPGATMATIRYTADHSFAVGTA